MQTFFSMQDLIEYASPFQKFLSRSGVERLENSYLILRSASENLRGFEACDRGAMAEAIDEARGLLALVLSELDTTQNLFKRFDQNPRTDDIQSRPNDETEPEGSVASAGMP